MRRAPVLFAAAVGALPLCAPAPARACSIAAPTAHVVDPAMQATDQMAPTLSPIPAPTIGRGFAPGGCSGSSSSCDDIGVIQIQPKATDDMTPAEQIGFRITLAGGTLPAGLTLPADAIDLTPGYPIVGLIWVDGATNDQDPVDFTLSIVAVDRAGNESAPQTVVVHDDGGGSGGSSCQLSSGHSGRSGRTPAPAAICLTVFALLVATRRRRHSPKRM
jgi:hypothetical protein